MHTFRCIQLQEEPNKTEYDIVKQFITCETNKHTIHTTDRQTNVFLYYTKK